MKSRLTAASRPRVVILGGGFAGLESAFTLRQRLGDRVDMALVAREPTFLFKPNTIYIPFGGGEERLYIPLSRPLRRRDIRFQQGTVAEVDADRRTVELEDRTRLPYDFLVLATGATMRPDEVPGLGEFAQTIWTPAQMQALGARMRRIKEEAKAGRRAEVLFVVPPNNKCSGPLYEIVFMLETWLRRGGIRDKVDLTWTTYESGYIQAFGPRLHEVVAREFAARGIEGYTDSVVSKVGPDEVVYTDGSVSRPYDLLIAFPPYGAAGDYPALPRDDRGFVRTELGTRRVLGNPDVYAPGDAGDFPVKQAFLAFLQADAAADDIASAVDPRLAAKARPFDPVSMCVMEMFDTATFAQVPLELSGDPARPVRVRAGADGQYRVGVRPTWRLGKKALGLYLPIQFKAGRPFHGGRSWQAMELALRGMSRFLATGANT
jgi:sulfide:quinone oxidoreductase